MKLLVNLSSLNHPLTGIGEYTLNLVKEMLDDDQVQDIKGIRSSRYLDRHQISVLIAALEQGHQTDQPLTRYLKKMSRLKLIARIARKAINAYREISFRFYRNMLKHYIYWEPNYICLNHQGVCVPTVHDLSHLICPQFHPKARVKYLKAELPRTLARAKHVIVVSQYTKQSVMEHFDLDDQQITVVPPSVKSEYYPRTASECAQLKKRLGLPENFILFVGTLEPRKNLQGLLLAYKLLSTELKSQYPLVLSGKKGWLLEDIEQILQPMLDSGEVIWLGYLNSKDLPALYSSATAFTYVSHFEGFGMPIAEAMACGTAVIASDNTAMKEASGGAVCIVSPHSIGSIAQGMRKVLLDSSYRIECETKGLEISKNRSWKVSKQLLVTALSNLNNGAQI
jgi:glycosyltransferase involved in cell wall biosynthesis